MFSNIYSMLTVRIALAGTLIAGLLGLQGISWNTFLGGSTTDEGIDITVDSNGNSYVIGYSNSNWGTPLHANSGDYDAFLAKINMNGGRVWHTFLGGTNMDIGEDIALDDSGNIYVTGTSRETWGTPLLPFGGFYDTFVAKLNSEGVLQWSTFLGGEGYDGGQGIAVDGSENVYVTGQSGGGWGIPLNPPPGAADRMPLWQS